MIMAQVVKIVKGGFIRGFDRIGRPGMSASGNGGDCKRDCIGDGRDKTRGADGA